MTSVIPLWRMNCACVRRWQRSSCPCPWFAKQVMASIACYFHPTPTSNLFLILNFRCSVPIIPESRQCCSPFRRHGESPSRSRPPHLFNGKKRCGLLLIGCLCLILCTQP